MSSPSAPGVTRLGDAAVNFYLVETPDGLVLIDAGLPGHLGQLEAHLHGTGRSLSDISALLLTHAHPDHYGAAAAVHRAGADVWVHEADVSALENGPRAAMKEAKPERSLLPYLLRHPASVGTIAHAARLGGFRPLPVTGTRAIGGDGELADVPGRPAVIELPGHTPGSVGYLFADRGLLFTGDALVTYDGLTGRTGPSLPPRAFTHDSRRALLALAKLEVLDAEHLFPGHGEPVTGSPADAAAQARDAGLL